MSNLTDYIYLLYIYILIYLFLFLFYFLIILFIYLFYLLRATAQQVWVISTHRVDGAATLQRS